MIDAQKEDEIGKSIIFIFILYYMREVIAFRVVDLASLADATTLPADYS